MADEILTPAVAMISGGNFPTAGTGFLPTGSRTIAVADALARFSKDKPNVAFGAVAGNGTELIDLSTAFATWVEAFSVVTAVDSPWIIGEDNQLDFEDWLVVDHPTTGKTLWLKDRAPPATETVRVAYTVLWTEATVPEIYLYSVARLAAAGMARMVAARMAQSNESTISVDTFRTGTAAGDWLRIAKDLEAQYAAEVGVGSPADKDAGPAAACIVMSFDADTGHGYGKLHEYYED